MKTILCMLFACAAWANAQAVNAHHAIFNTGKDGPSKPYLARTPYVLHWNVDPTRKLYDKNDPVKVESYVAGIHVVDVATGRIIHSVSNVEFTGSTRVPVAGRHTVEFFSTAPWQASFVENKATLEAAAGRGKLKDDKTVEEAANAGGGSADGDANSIIQELSAKFSGRELDDRLAAVRLVASRSANAEDFKKRWADYCRANGW